MDWEGPLHRPKSWWKQQERCVRDLLASADTASLPGLSPACLWALLLARDPSAPPSRTALGPHRLQAPGNKRTACPTHSAAPNALSPSSSSVTANCSSGSRDDRRFAGAQSPLSPESSELSLQLRITPQNSRLLKNFSKTSMQFKCQVICGQNASTHIAEMQGCSSSEAPRRVLKCTAKRGPV